MAFTGRSVGEAARALIDRTDHLLARTVTRARLVFLIVPSSERGHAVVPIAFRQAGEATTAPLQTRFGRMDLFLGQVCESRASANGIHTFDVVSYKYTLTAAGEHEARLRWEYVRQPADPNARWCRHHLQGAMPLRFANSRQVLLNDFHLPTGWVPIEEVLTESRGSTSVVER